MRTEHELKNFTGRWRGKYFNDGCSDYQRPVLNYVLYKAEYLPVQQVVINLGLAEGEKRLEAVVKPITIREQIPLRINEKS